MMMALLLCWNCGHGLASCRPLFVVGCTCSGVLWQPCMVLVMGKLMSNGWVTYVQGRAGLFKCVSCTVYVGKTWLGCGMHKPRLSVGQFTWANRLVCMAYDGL